MKHIVMMGVAVGMLAGTAWSQETRPHEAWTQLGGSTQAATKPAFTDIEAGLAQELREFSAENQPLDRCVKFLRDEYNINIAINWPALEAAGVKRDTPLTFSLRHTSVEQGIKALCELTPAKSTRLNYIVGDGAVEITTNEQLAAGHETRIFDLSIPLKMQLMPSPVIAPAPTLPATTAAAPVDELREARAQKILAVIRAELTRIGAHPEAPDRELVIRKDKLLATQSPRAQVTILRIVQSLCAPLKPGSVPPGVVASVRQKKAEEQMLKLLKEHADNPPALQAIAEAHAKYAPDLNVVPLPGVPLGVDPGSPLHLDYVVNESGLVLIGPAEAIRARTLLAVYDLRDLIKRLSLKPENKTASPAELSARILATLKKKVTPDLWTDLNQGPCSLTEYEGLLIVIAPPPVYRAFGSAWKEAEK
jgi:hypothetical protein